MRPRGARAAERGEVPLREAAQGRAPRSPRLLELRKGHRVRRRGDREAPGSRLQGIRLRRHVALPPDPGHLLRVPQVGREGLRRGPPAPPDGGPPPSSSSAGISASTTTGRWTRRFGPRRPSFPVFVLDDHYLTDDFSPPRLAFLAESLRELAGALAAKGLAARGAEGAAGRRARRSRRRRPDAEAVFTHADHEPHGTRSSSRRRARRLRRRASRSTRSRTSISSLRMRSRRKPGSLSRSTPRFPAAGSSATRRPPSRSRPASRRRTRVRAASFPVDPCSTGRAASARRGLHATRGAGRREARRVWDAFCERRALSATRTSATGRISPARRASRLICVSGRSGSAASSPRRRRRGRKRLPPGGGASRRSSGSSPGGSSTRRPLPPPARSHGELPGRVRRVPVARGRGGRPPLRRVGGGPHRLSDRGRGDAAAPRGRLDAQPRADDRRVVSHEGPPRRLAARRAFLPPLISPTATRPRTAEAGSGPRARARTRSPSSASSIRSSRAGSSTPTRRT